MSYYAKGGGDCSLKENTTMEQIGTVGREEGIAAQSSVLLYKDDFLA